MLNRRPGGPLFWVMAFFTSSYQQLVWSPTQSGAPSPFGLVWLSLPHLVYNSVRSLTQLSWLLSWLSYIIVQRPLSRLLDPWNRMFDRHQAEITVMQFTGHSLPVRQSMSVPWEFFYLVPFCQPISAQAISSHNCHYNVSPLPLHPLGMAFLAGSKAKIQQNSNSLTTASQSGTLPTTPKFTPTSQ